MAGGRFGGDADEFKLALHPDDRHLADGFYELADKQDWFPVEYRIRRPENDPGYREAAKSLRAARKAKLNA